MNGWIGVDLDRTLAYHDVWRGADHVGEPIQPMLDRVKGWLEAGYEVRIFTARVSRPVDADIALQAIEEWCLEHVGKVLPVTCTKDWAMIELWDDRAVQVIANTGVPLGHSKLD